MTNLIPSHTTKIIDQSQLFDIGIHDLEKFYSTLLDSSPDGILIIDVESKNIVFANPTICTMLQYARDELLSMQIYDIHPEDDLPYVLKEFDAMTSNQSFNPFLPCLRKDKTILYVDLNGINISFGGRSYNLGFYRDITDRKQMLDDMVQSQEQLKESEFTLHSILRAIPDIIYRLNHHGMITYVSESIRRYGYHPEDMVGRDILEFVHPDDREKARFKMRERRTGDRRTKAFEVRMVTQNAISVPFEVRYRKLNNYSIFLIDAEGMYATKQPKGNSFLGTQGIARDISDRKWLEAQLLQSQKLEAIGTLAGGIAHDFNNILAGIIGYAELANLCVEKNGKASNYLNKLLKASDRAKKLIHQILSFSRESTHELMPILITPILKEVLKLLRSTLPSTVEIQVNLECNDGYVLADPTQIHQILMNLSTNASDAMAGKGGILKVSLTSEDIPPDNPMSLMPGTYLKLSVSDTGQGIRPEYIERIFDPYFTTKEKGRGTGLGLAIIFAIVKNHGGAVNVKSKLGEGSTFAVYLPKICPPKTNFEMVNSETLPGGTEKILFVDDEPNLVEIMGDLLERLGYRIVVKTSGKAALDYFIENSDQIDLLITDMTMPEMTGVQIAQEVLKICPNIPVILCTGYSELISEEIAASLGITKYIMKPIDTKELATIVREALDGNTNAN